MIAPLLEPFVAEHPELEIELTADARHLNPSRGEADIALRPSRFEHQKIVQRKVCHVAFALYARTTTSTSSAKASTSRSRGATGG